MPQLLSLHFRAHEPQLLSSYTASTEAHIACAPQQEKPPQGEAHAPQLESSFHLLQLERIYNNKDIAAAAAAAAMLFQSCLTLCNPIDGSPPDSPIPGILQARTLEWVAISFSNALKWKVKVKSFSRVQLSATPRTAAYQAPPLIGFSRQEYQSGVPLPSPILHYRQILYHLSQL